MEIWKNILGFTNYQVSNLGNVKNISSGRVLRKTINSRGYHIVSLYIKGKIYVKYIHRLIAETFLEKEFGLNTVNHIDGIKTNNCISNLEWCTQSYNVSHSYRIGTSTPRKGPAYTKKVKQFTLSGEFIKEWDSLTDVKKTLGIGCSSVSSACSGVYHTAGGFIWSK